MIILRSITVDDKTYLNGTLIAHEEFFTSNFVHIFIVVEVCIKKQKDALPFCLFWEADFQINI